MEQKFLDLIALIMSVILIPSYQWIPLIILPVVVSDESLVDLSTEGGLGNDKSNGQHCHLAQESIVFFRAFHYTESLKANLTAKTFPVRSVSPQHFCCYANTSYPSTP